MAYNTLQDVFIHELSDMLNAEKQLTKALPKRDVALIAAAQKVEHYEIAGYGTLTSLADLLGFDDAADLLEEILEEEKATDEKLTGLAEGGINEDANEMEIAA